MANIPVSGLNPGSPAQTTDLIPLAREVDGQYLNFSVPIQAIIELFSVVGNPLSIQVFSAFSGSLNLSIGTSYVVSSASASTGTLPLSPILGAVIEVTSLAGNTGGTNILSQGSNLIYYTGESGSTLSSDAPFTAILRYSETNVWNVIGWKSAGSIILT